jgi:hypothetical protein
MGGQLLYLCGMVDKRTMEKLEKCVSFGLPLVELSFILVLSQGGQGSRSRVMVPVMGFGLYTSGTSQGERREPNAVRNC